MRMLIKEQFLSFFDNSLMLHSYLLMDSNERNDEEFRVKSDRTGG
jgi:hypothetical protein